MRSERDIEQLLSEIHDRTVPQFDMETLDKVWTAMEATRWGKTVVFSRQTTTEGVTIQRRAISIAAAIVLTAGIVFLIQHWVRQQANDTMPQKLQRVEIISGNKESVPPANALHEDQLTLAHSFFEQKDIAGLLNLLETGSPDVKIAVAGYLVQIGDPSALPELQRLADQWDGPSGDNPFAKAIQAIQAQLETEDDSGVTDMADTNEVSVQVPVTMATEPQTGIAGVVLDKLTLEPIPGAIIQTRLSDPNTAVTSNASGRFELLGLSPFENTYVYCMAEGYKSERIIVPVVRGQVTEDIRIEFSRGSRIRGRVTDSDGRPIAGAVVKTFYFTNRPIPTGPDGNYEIDGLDPVVDRYSLQVTHPNYPAVSTSFTPGAVGETVLKDVILKSGVDVFGRVTDQDGKPISNVLVGNTRSFSMWNSIQVRTDDQGGYRLDNVDEGELFIWAAHPEYALYVKQTQLKSGVGEQRIDIELKTPVPLFGKIVDQEARPVPGVTIVVHEYNGVSNLAQQRFTSDENGEFVITNAPAEGKITLNPFGQGISSKMHAFILGQEEYIVKVQRAGRVYGRVIDSATNEPVQQFTVKLSFSDVVDSPSGYSARWNREGYQFTSEEGLFDTGREDLPVGGEYQMTVYAEGYDPLTLDPVPVQSMSSDPNRTEFRLSTATVLAGTVVDKAGEPIADAVVALTEKRSEARYWSRFTTDTAGVFVISGIGSKQQYVYVTAPGYAPYYCQISELLAETDPVIVLSRGGRIYGTVLDEQGQPASGRRIQINVSPDNDANIPSYLYRSLKRETVSDQNGRYEKSGLLPGRLDVRLLSRTGDRSTHKQVILQSSQSLRVDLGP